jgi:hypothetical protein
MSPQTDKPNLLAILNTIINKYDMFRGFNLPPTESKMQVMIDAMMYACRFRATSGATLLEKLHSVFDLHHITDEVDNAILDIDDAGYDDEYRTLVIGVVNANEQAFKELFNLRYFCMC